MILQIGQSGSRRVHTDTEKSNYVQKDDCLQLHNFIGRSTIFHCKFSMHFYKYHDESVLRRCSHIRLLEALVHEKMCIVLLEGMEEPCTSPVYLYL